MGFLKITKIGLKISVAIGILAIFGHLNFALIRKFVFGTDIDNEEIEKGFVNNQDEVLFASTSKIFCVFF
jgi:hypothetical protein